MKIFNATITHVSGKGVQATGHRLPKPEIFYKHDQDKHAWDDFYTKQEEAYESSKFTAWVENIETCQGCDYALLKWYDPGDGETKYGNTEIRVGMSCQVLETGDGKCKVIKLK